LNNLNEQNLDIVFQSATVLLQNPC